jgi:alcohol dehydrogenase class IV
MATSSAAFPSRPFVSPGRVLHGLGTARYIGAELRAVGTQPDVGVVLVVADAVLVELGLIDSIVASLRDAGFDPRVGPAVAREPTPETVESLLAAADGGTVAAVVGVGGGSAIDASKLVAAAATNALELTVGLPATTVLRDGPVLAAIPTTAGTGAEATAVAMLWHEGRKRIFVNERLVPRHATLDPALMRALPGSVMAASGLDAVSHAIESLLSSFRTPLTIASATSALRRLAAALPVAFAEPDDDTRSEMLLGAHEAGLALNASVVSGHSIAYAIASRAGLSHGVTCAMALPYCLAYTRAAATEIIADIGAIVDGDRAPDATLSWSTGLAASLGMPASLREVGIALDDVPCMASEIADLYPRPNSPAPLQSKPLERLLTHFHAGDIAAAWDDDTARPLTELEVA